MDNGLKWATMGQYNMKCGYHIAHFRWPDAQSMFRVCDSQVAETWGNFGGVLIDFKVSG